MLSVALHQLAILFYCETPGILTAERGATGFYPRSHLVVHEGLGKLLEKSSSNGSKDPLQWGAIGFALREVFRASRALGLSDDGGNGSNPIPLSPSKVQVGDLLQPELAENEVLLSLGTTVHTAMFASEFMPNNNPRVIQNLKVSANDGMLALHGKELADLKKKGNDETYLESMAVRAAAQEEFLSRIKRDSLLFRTFTRPLATLSAGSGQFLMQVTLSRSGDIPSLLKMCLNHNTLGTPNRHFFILSVKLYYRNLVNSASSLLLCFFPFFYGQQYTNIYHCTRLIFIVYHKNYFWKTKIN